MKYIPVHTVRSRDEAMTTPVLGLLFSVCHSRSADDEALINVLGYHNDAHPACRLKRSYPSRLGLRPRVRFFYRDASIDGAVLPYLVNQCLNITCPCHHAFRY